MSDHNASSPDGRFEVRASVSDHFSWLRTRLSIERTLMSWVRTATALIGFGFTITQFFDRLATLPSAAPASFPAAPRYLGLMLIFCGVLSLGISAWQYEMGLRYLFGKEYTAIAGVSERPSRTPLLAVTVALSLAGVFAFFAVFLRYV